MTTIDVSDWLTGLGLSEYLPVFTSNNISSDDLPFLDQDILKDIGVSKVGDRIKLERAIIKLKDTSNEDQYQISIEQIFDRIKLNAKPIQLHSFKSDINTHILPNISNTNKSEFKLGEPPNATGKTIVSFILQNGSTVRINVNGCFNAASIKKKLVKFLNLPVKDPSNYDAYITDQTGNLHLLFDVELVTICHSSDRIEKRRILFCPKTEEPSTIAVEVSKKYIALEKEELRQERSQTEDELSKDSDVTTSSSAQDSKFRTVFGQRPTSELISTNLSQYFPEESTRKLSETIRKSVRYSMLHNAHNKRLSTVGDILRDNHNKRLSMLTKSNIDVPTTRGGNNNEDTLDLKSSMNQNKQRFSVASSINEEGGSKIELFSLDSDSEDEDINDQQMVQQVNNVHLSTSGPTNWLKGARIGSGSFGTVYLGMNSTTGELMAVKQVELQPLFEDATSDPHTNQKQKQQQKQIHAKIVDALQHEMRLLSELHHENIVTYLGSNSDDSHWNIFLEYVPGGSLNTMLSNYGPFEEPLIRNFTRQILIGLNYLHSQNIIHRDIKGANILIDLKGGVKISDFGISKKLTHSSSSKRASLQGSVYWMAPEVVKQQATTTKADIWSVGCLVVEMFTAKHPFPNFSQMQAIFKIGTHHTPDIPRWCSEQAKDFLKETFKLDYEKRLGASGLLHLGFMEPLIS